MKVLWYGYMNQECHCEEWLQPDEAIYNLSKKGKYTNFVVQK